MIFKVFALLTSLLAGAAPSPQSLPIILVRAPKAALSLQVARTGSQRERGLMGVRHLAPHSGMLFVFDADAPVAFWMKNTLIPLDMVFITSSGSVRRVFANVSVLPANLPDQKIPLEQDRAKYVIELPANEAARDGIRAGSYLSGIPGAGTSGS